MPFTAIDHQGYRTLLNALPPRVRSRAIGVIVEMLFRIRRSPGTETGSRSLVDLEPGQFWFGWEELGKAGMVGEQTVKTIMKHFQKRGILTTKSTNEGHTATVINPERYVYMDEQSNQQSNKQVTSIQQASNNKQHVKQVEHEKHGTSKPTCDLERILAAFNENLPDHQKRMTPDAVTNIERRLKTFTEDQLVTAVVNWCHDDFSKKHNHGRPISWFFKTTERVETYLNGHSLQPKEEQRGLWSQQIARYDPNADV